MEKHDRARRSPVLPLLAALVATACGGRGDGPDPIRPAEDACAACRMQIVQERFAGEIRAPDGQFLKFDDLGCMLGRLRAEPALGRAPAWVVDFETGKWIEARSAAFALSQVRTPMGSGLLALESEERARARGELRRLAELMGSQRR